MNDINKTPPSVDNPQAIYKKGTRVRYISKDADGMYYPPYGTLGTCTGGCDLAPDGKQLIRVKWDEGTKDNGMWWCYDTDVELVKEETK